MTCCGDPGVGAAGSSLPVLRHFIDVRTEKCRECEHYEDNNCRFVEAQHPGKSSISHGVLRPGIRCPLPYPKWIEEPAECPGCHRQGKIINEKDELCDRCLLRQAVTGRPTSSAPQVITKSLITGSRTVVKQKGSPFTATGEPQWVSVQQLATDAATLAQMLPSDVRAIVGVARSGMTPAAMVATILHLPLLAIRQTKHDVIDVGNGWRIGSGSDHVETMVGSKVAIIDDTVMTGNSFKDIRDIVAEKFPNNITCALYVNPLARMKPDVWVHDLGWPHLLEWNLFNSILSPNAACDFDGILCDDCPHGSDDDGPRYLEFINNARPKYLARRTAIPLIVTARIEKYRAATEAWLARWGIRFHRLVMHPAATLAERNRDDIAAYKAKHFAAWSAGHKPHPAPLLFIESEDWQANRIGEITGLMSVCPASENVYPKGIRNAEAATATLVQPIDIQKRANTVSKLIAVTSLSEMHYHIGRQRICLDTWRAVGLEIHVVNTTTQIKRLSAIYPQVTNWIPCDVTTSAFGKTTQQISRLARVAIDTDRTILLINSDIEILGNIATIIDKMGGNKLVGGIRWNYENIETATREQWGIDAFVITPEMAATISPAMEMQIGKPIWDYWLPLHFKRLGYDIELVGEPLFFHQSHPVLWNDKDMAIGIEIVKKQYRIDWANERLRTEFRQTLVSVRVEK